MTAIFPASIPAPLIAGYGVTSEDRADRTMMAGGNVKSRRVRGPAPLAHDVAWTLTATERAALYAFAAVVRADWFLCPLAIPGAGLRSVRARFIAPPSAPIGLSAIATNVTGIRARLLVEDAVIVGDSDVLVASDGSGDPLAASDGGGDPLLWEALF